MTRFLVAPVVAAAVALLTATPAQADVQLPNLGQCVSVKETGTQIGFQVCTPPTS